MSPAEPAPRSGRTRRSGPEVRALLLEAAQELFATQGYGATTRLIAERAGVSDVLIYRHFGSKAGLFEKAVLEPIAGFIEGYLSSSADDLGTASVEELSARYVEGLHDLLDEHRGLLVAFLQVRRGGDEDDSDVGAGPSLGALLNGVGDLVEALDRQYRWADVDSEVTVRVAFAMILGMALLGDAAFPRGRRPNRDRVREEMARFIHHRVAYRPPAEVDRPAPRRR